MALMWVKISAVFFAVAAFFALTAVGSAEDSAEKIKWRPMAADEKTGEADILFSQLSGNTKGRILRISPGGNAYSLFVRPQTVSLAHPVFVKGVGQTMAKGNQMLHDLQQRGPESGKRERARRARDEDRRMEDPQRV
jgi:hypothetical protein